MGVSLRDELEHLRDELRQAFDVAPVAVKAQIAGQLRAVIKDLAALGEPEGTKSVADEIAARRAAKGSAPAGRRRKSGRG